MNRYRSRRSPNRAPPLTLSPMLSPASSNFTTNHDRAMQSHRVTNAFTVHKSYALNHNYASFYDYFQFLQPLQQLSYADNRAMGCCFLAAPLSHSNVTSVSNFKGLAPCKRLSPHSQRSVQSRCTDYRIPMLRSQSATTGEGATRTTSSAVGGNGCARARSRFLLNSAYCWRTKAVNVSSNRRVSKRNAFR